MRILSQLSRRSARRKGLTLVEILVVSAIFVIVVTSLLFVFKAGLQSWQKAQAHLEIYQNARTAIDMITRDFKAAYLDTANPSMYFLSWDNGTPWVGPPIDTANGDMPLFAAALNPSLNNADATSEICKVGYWLNTDHSLRRIFVYPRAGDNISTFYGFVVADLTGNSSIVASNITNFNLNFYDSAGTITGGWNSTNPANPTQFNQKPTKVEITLTVREPASGKTQTFITGVYIPR